MLYILIPLVLGINIQPLPTSMSPPTVRRSLSAVYSPSDNSAYFFGGCKYSAETYSNVMWRFDLSLNKWEHLDMRTYLLPEARYGSSMALYKDKIYIFGGSTHLGPGADLWTYGIKSNIWLEILCLGDQPQELALSGFTTFIWDNQTWFGIFGGNSMRESATNELYM